MGDYFLKVMATMPVLAASALSRTCGFAGCDDGCGVVGVCVTSGLSTALVLAGGVYEGRVGLGLKAAGVVVLSRPL